VVFIVDATEGSGDGNGFKEEKIESPMNFHARACPDNEGTLEPIHEV
jgi:hypothetical protein